MTLIGHDSSYASRVLRGIRRVLDPRPRPRVRPRRTAVVSHRGDDQRAPENTVEACRLAVEQGADGVEVDVCVTLDGHAVLWHDHNPDAVVAIARQRGIEGRPFAPWVPGFGARDRRRIAELTLGEMRERHGYERIRELPEDHVEGIWPVDTFADLAEWVAAEARLRDVVLDVKLGPSELDRVESLLEELRTTLAGSESHAERAWWLLTPELEVFEALRRGVRRRDWAAPVTVVPDFELPGVIETARDLDARHVGIGINPRRTRAATRDDIVRAVRAREQGELDWILVWSVDDEEVLHELGRLAVDAVITDDVPLARRILDEEHGRHQRLLRRRARARIRLPDDKVR